MKKIVVKDNQNLPRPRAPYAQVVRAGNLVFMSGAVGRAADGTLARDDLKAQFRQALDNTRIALAAVGARPEDVVRVTELASPEYLVEMDAIAVVE